MGMTWTAASAAMVTEPSAAVLALSGMILAIGRRCLLAEFVSIDAAEDIVKLQEL